MIDSKFLTSTLKTTVSLLLMAGIWLLPLNMVAKTAPTPKDTAQQLEGIVARNWSQWSWGVGGAVAYLGSDSAISQPSARATETSSAIYSDSVYELTNHSSSDWEVQAASQDWLNLNRGDGSQDLVRIVIFRF
ncbi:MAG: hypothetical protein QNJ72_17845 [Pleurocapsa sp. MO_226.B13]|nr:hypothetical protein [Pleurocapsa sp. MO_226.B13]